ncbi:MAG: hypothetical protein MUF54_15415, partial [Polyangiaceae bacterium]|nr:hypothetical protein [Polyangiaceae bacterium]
PHLGLVNPTLLILRVSVVNSPGGFWLRLCRAMVWGPLELHHDAGVPGGHGGPPTASDFDGDGQVELAAAANPYCAVYDPDCVAVLNGANPPEGPGGACSRAPSMASLPDGILWAQPSQDFSSSGTGSSIFDFDGNRTGEAVYGDECYVRVYAGATGEVSYSASASSGTGFELSVIVDVDGDFASEIIVARSLGPACPASDPLFPGSPGFVRQGGFVILRDPEDRWAASRPIWASFADPSIGWGRVGATCPPTRGRVANVMATFR